MRGIQIVAIHCWKNFPNFEMLDARIASALNKIIQKSHFKKKVSFEEQKAQKEDRFLRRRQIAFMIYDYFRVTGAHDTVLDYADLLSMSKIPSDDVLESLYNLRIRESAQLKTVLELYEMEIHQKDIDAQISKIEDDGEKKKRSETPIEKL